MSWYFKKAWSLVTYPFTAGGRIVSTQLNQQTTGDPLDTHVKGSIPNNTQTGLPLPDKPLNVHKDVDVQVTVDDITSLKHDDTLLQSPLANACNSSSIVKNDLPESNQNNQSIDQQTYARPESSFDNYGKHDTKQVSSHNSPVAPRRDKNDSKQVSPLNSPITPRRDKTDTNQVSPLHSPMAPRRDMKMSNSSSKTVPNDQDTTGDQPKCQTVQAERSNTTPFVQLKDDNNTPKGDAPGKPFPSAIRSDAVELSWTGSPKSTSSCYYKIRYKQVDVQRWIYYDEEPTNPHVTVTSLKTETKYWFQVRVVDGDDEGPFSPKSDTITTKASPASKLTMSHTTKLISDGDPKVYKISTQEIGAARDTVMKTRKLEIGPKSSSYLREKTILFIGATGAGKSTMVDAIVNHALTVRWEDDFRYTLVDLEDEESQHSTNEAMSQTEWITCYSIYPESDARIDYKLNIIDTPGYGDPRGLERDEEITKQIKKLFSSKDEKGITCIDAVCFLVKASETRLTATLKYVFSSMVAIFGKDIESNVCTFITFADGNSPKVLSALQEANMPYRKWYPFNNSCLFELNACSGSGMYTLSWKMGEKSFTEFFTRLFQMQTKSLQLTNEVLEERESLSNTIYNLQKLVNKGLNMQNSLKQEQRIVDQHKLDIDSNKDFEYTVTESKLVKFDTPVGLHVTVCTNCHYTCHYDCAYANDDQKRGCVAMDGSGYCKECKDKCFWDKHSNLKYYFETEDVQIKKKYSEKFAKLESAKAELAPHAAATELIENELDETQAEVAALLDKINECKNRLDKIALRPNSTSMIEHINIMIQSEKNEKKDGFIERIEILEGYKQRAEIEKHAAKFQQQNQARLNTS